MGKGIGPVLPIQRGWHQLRRRLHQRATPISTLLNIIFPHILVRTPEPFTSLHTITLHALLYVSHITERVERLCKEEAQGGRGSSQKGQQGAEVEVVSGAMLTRHVGLNQPYYSKL